MEVADDVTIHCCLPEVVNDRFSRSVLCRAMQESARGQATVREHDGDLSQAPSQGFLVVEAWHDTAERSLSAAQLRQTFLLDGAKGPALYRFLEKHQMPGGFQSEEWFQVEDLQVVRFPVLRIEVAEALGLERVRQYQTEHYAQYNPGVDLATFLVRYLVAFHRWRDQMANR